MDQEKVQARQHMWMEVFTKVNGKMIKNMEMEFFNTSMGLNTMENGKMTFVTVLGHIFIPMETSTREIGMKISRKEWVLITTLMEIFTRDNGRMASQMERGIIFIKVEKQYIRVTGKTGKKRVLES
jgi:hypothetical protein